MVKTMKIQIIEDDRALGDGIALALAKPEYEFTRQTTLADAKDAFSAGGISLVILDLNLPDGNGLDFLCFLREKPSDVPVLILTANDEEIDEVTGLSLGADDYVTKPFSLAVLRARVEALLRRGEMARADDFDFSRQKFSVNGETVEFSLSEQKLLKLFLSHKGQLLTRDTLSDALWGDGGAYVDENALSVGINRLRAKLGEMGGCIRTVYGQGYLWDEESA